MEVLCLLNKLGDWFVDLTSHKEECGSQSTNHDETQINYVLTHMAFPAPNIGYIDGCMFSHAWNRLHVSAFTTGCMLTPLPPGDERPWERGCTRVWHRLHAFRVEF